MKWLVLFVFLLLPSACGRNGYEPETPPVPYETPQETPAPAPTPAATPTATPAPTPQPTPAPHVVSFESGILGLHFTFTLPAAWPRSHVHTAWNLASRDTRLFDFRYFNNLPDGDFFATTFELWESSIHPRSWYQLFTGFVSLDHPGMMRWVQPDEAYRVFTTPHGITVVEYRTRYDDWFGEYTTAVFVMRRDGRDYREIDGIQLFFTATLQTRTTHFDYYYADALLLLYSLQFHEGAVISLTPGAQADAIGITAYNFPRIDGSTSTVGITAQTIRAMFDAEPSSSYLPWSASRTIPAYRLLIAQYVDMILVPDPSAYVLALAEEAGVALEFIPIAVEALVFITHIDNPVESITLEQARQIYAYRTITNWQALGGRPGDILPFNRNPHSGSQTQMDNLVLQGRETHPDLARYQVGGMWDMLSTVAFPVSYYGQVLTADNFALGFTVYFYLRQAQSAPFEVISQQVKPLALDGVFPSHETILSGAYPLATHYFAVIRADSPPDSPERRIIEWLLTPAGQDAVEAAGIGRLLP